MKLWPFKRAAKPDQPAPTNKAAKVAKSKPAGAKGKTVIEYLPDADEIERSPVPRAAQMTLHVLLLCFLSFGIWAGVSQLDKVVVAQGRLVNPLPNVVVQPLETSIVQSVDVRVGQVVKKGDQLAALDATFAEADASQLKARLDSLETQVSGLEQELAGDTKLPEAANSADGKLQAELQTERRANYRAQQSRMSEVAGRLRATLQTNRNDQRLLEARLRSFKEVEGMQEKMVAQKFGASIQLIEAQQRSKEVERELALTRNREDEVRRDLAAADAERNAFERGWRQKAMEELLSVTRERDSLKEQLQKADKRQRLVLLTAPIDSVVLEIAKLSPGSIAKAAETFFTLVPLNVTMEAEVRIDAADIGFIKLGDPVRIKVDAYPFQKHGMLDGTVRTISQDAFRRDAGDRTGSDSYYTSRVTLTTTALRNMGESGRLLPGMTLSGEVVVGQRSLMSYLAWPLTKGMSEAIREP